GRGLAPLLAQPRRAHGAGQRPAAGFFRADARPSHSLAGGTRMTFRPIIVVCAAIMAAAPCTDAMAQAPEPFRTRPITLIVPFPARGPSDALAQGMAAQ